MAQVMSNRCCRPERGAGEPGEAGAVERRDTSPAGGTPKCTESARMRRSWPIVLILCACAARAAPADSLASRLTAAAPDANPQVLSLAAKAAGCAMRRGLLDGLHHLAVIDYSLPSTEPRLWVFDVDRGRLLFEELVAHGRNTGEDRAEHFSNEEGSRMSSLGLYETADTYDGRNGYSLRLRGLDAGFNDHALARAIVMHGAPYVSETIATRLGRLGRSWGCPAVRTEVARVMIDTLKGGALLFAYYPDPKWLAESPMLTCAADAAGQVAATAGSEATPG
jgi:hypothetical protein